MMESAGQMTYEVSSSFGDDIGLPNHGPGLVPSSSHAPEIRISTRRDLDSFSDLAPVDTAHLPESNIPRASCPHVDCQTRTTQLYRLQLRDSEDLSEMCLHLFHTHHTTPYPCSEPACARKGTEGFFMQADLVRHVRIFHKSLAALQRLRGRVDEDLLNCHLRPSSSQAEHKQDAKPSDTQVESDFMADFNDHKTRFASSNANASSSSSADRTLTPRMTAGPSGPSESTPMTSISSLLVHHSSDTTVGLRSKSKPYDVQYPVIGIRETREKMDESLQSASSIARDHAYSSVTHSPQFERPRDLSDPFVTQPDKGSQTSPRMSARSRAAVVVANGSDVTTIELDSAKSCEPASEALKNMIVPNTERHAIFSRQIPDSQSSAATIPYSSLPQQSKPEATSSTKASSSFRTTIDASYDFSDDEEGITSVLKPSTAAGHTPQPILTLTDVDTTNTVILEQGLQPNPMLPSATALRPELPAVSSSTSVDDSRPNSASRSYLPSQRSAMPPPITPASRIPRISVAPHLLDDDDFDELSMLGDEFALQRSPKPQLKHKILARHRANMKDPSSVPSKTTNMSKRATKISETAPVPGKKRTIDDFRSGQASSSKTGHSLRTISPSRHEAVPITGSSASKFAPFKVINDLEPVIKTEADDSTPTLPKRRGRPPKNHIEPVPVPPNSAPKESPKPAKRARPRIRAKTPSLDLTPRRAAQHKRFNKDEVADSAAESSSPLAGVATPIRLKAPFQHPLESGHALPVIRTPGGTWRRCGEGGVECKTAFCFRCTKKVEALAG